MRVPIVLAIAAITISINPMMSEIESGTGIEMIVVEVIGETEATIEVVAVEKVTETRGEIEQMIGAMTEVVVEGAIETTGKEIETEAGGGVRALVDVIPDTNKVKVTEKNMLAE
jgi:hypothetical protein